MQVPLPGPHLDVEVRDPPRRDLEDRDARLEQVPVEDDTGVAPTLVRRQEVDDRVAAGLFLAVAREPHVDRQRALGGQKRRRLQQEVELPLVVGHAARVEPPVAHRRLERRALPALERLRRLDVEVPVGDHRRCAVRVLRRAELADHERLVSRLDDLGLAPGGADEVAHPLGGAHDVGRPLRVRADAGDAEKLGELLHPLCWRLRHGRRSLFLYATSLSFWQSASARSFFRH